MRLTLQILGLELDISLGPIEAEPEPEFKPYQDAGTIGSERIAAGEQNAWEDPGSLHQFDPGEGDEERKRLLGFGR